jgi:hypothetical protein
MKFAGLENRVGSQLAFGGVAVAGTPSMGDFVADASMLCFAGFDRRENEQTTNLAASKVKLSFAAGNVTRS